MIKKIVITVLVAALILFIVLNWEWVSLLREENLSYFTDDLFSEMGYSILAVTIPLMIIQNVITVFPVIIVILIHFLIFGPAGGFLFSLIGTAAGSVLCFWLARSLSSKWMDRFWEKNHERIASVSRLISAYGVFMITVLRSIPVLPSNIISAAAAVSPINFKTYLWSSLFGNISMIWILSILSFPLWDDGTAGAYYLIGYFIFAGLVTGYYIKKFYRDKTKTFPPVKDLMRR